MTDYYGNDGFAAQTERKITEAIVRAIRSIPNDRTDPLATFEQAVPLACLMVASTYAVPMKKTRELFIEMASGAFDDAVAEFEKMKKTQVVR